MDEHVAQATKDEMGEDNLPGNYASELDSLFPNFPPPCRQIQVNCRRAASAAFQELVGRLGDFEHGIDIVVRLGFKV